VFADSRTRLRGGMHIIYNVYCLSFDGSKFCVTAGFWLIIMSSGIVIAPKLGLGLPNGKGSVLTVGLLDTENYRIVFKWAKFSPSFECCKAKRFSASGCFVPWLPDQGLCPRPRWGIYPPPHPRYRLTLYARHPVSFSLIPGSASLRGIIVLGLLSQGRRYAL